MLCWVFNTLLVLVMFLSIMLFGFWLINLFELYFFFKVVVILVSLSKPGETEQAFPKSFTSSLKALLVREVGGVRSQSIFIVFIVIQHKLVCSQDDAHASETPHKSISWTRPLFVYLLATLARIRFL